MYALVGQVRIKPGHVDEVAEMVRGQGIAMLNGMEGSAGGYWARTIDSDETIQHSFWLFENEEHARRAEEAFGSLRSMPDAPAEFVSVDVCELVGQA
jgi:hypothetical protein